ncbi:unnamed protein product [Trichobilharzia regenti]|nr:unnamed protein product [Trichobilharzia regenti]
MARESDNIHVAALALAVELPIYVENCQQSGELNRIEFPAHSDLMNMDDGDEQHVSDGTGGGGGGGGQEASNDSCHHQHSVHQEKDHTTDYKTNPPVTLLYRPGHYDILYPNSKK